MTRSLLLAPRSARPAGCTCCADLDASEARPGRAAPIRRTVKRRERRAWRAEVAAELVA